MPGAGVLACGPALGATVAAGAAAAPTFESTRWPPPDSVATGSGAGAGSMFSKKLSAFRALRALSAGVKKGSSSTEYEA